MANPLFQPRSQPDTRPHQSSPCVVTGNMVSTINGIPINFPDSEKLNWIGMNDPSPIDPLLVALGYAQVTPTIKANHTLRVGRYAIIGEYILLCGHYDPPLPDGSFNWVVNTNEMKYVGTFFDVNSR